MRAFEKSNDEKLRPDMYVVCRIDGRNFSTLTRKVLDLKPYDEKLAQCMHATVKYIMDCGFSCAFGYTQSDEISLLMDKHKQEAFAGKVRKYNSVLAAEASAHMTFLMDKIVTFDCRTIQLPTKQHVIDYFAWRRADSEKNCLNMWCYHIMTKQQGLTPTQAQRKMDNKSVAWKNEFLFQNGINFNNIPDWQKRGYGIYWKEYEKDGFNPITNKTVTALRRTFEQIILPKSNEDFNNLLSKFL